MDKRLSITGSTQDELKDALKLCGKMFGPCFCSYKLCPDTTRYHIEGIKDDTKPHPELHFYSYCRPSDSCVFPCIMPSDVVAALSWEWLETANDIDHSIHTDGSLAKGWHIEAGELLYEYEDQPTLVVKFETIVYGK